MGNGFYGCCGTKPEYKIGRPLISGKATPCFNDGHPFKVVKGNIWYF
ncbi:calpain family cysteine protease-like protein [Leishmania tarentolae]|uniref:Calpain family cysteine protease-like protein n=1 Tax=Leishmania tarentolae TaxID=5689 RepID=A0A640KIE7_LEITA|nr:calpain family cysteine protease-like protein [Leishmania tarentolae]